MLKQRIIDLLQSLLKDMGISDIIPQLDIPTDLSHGDYTSNVSFQISKQLKKSPMEVADEIAEKLSSVTSQLAGIEKIEGVKPGFINFWVAKEELIEVLRKPKQHEVKGTLSNKKFLVEYAHPNTHKEMHIGHMRTLITGEALSRLLESQGTTVFRANYQGDIGPHVAKAMYGVEKFIKEKGLSLEEIALWSNTKKAQFLGEGYVRGNVDYEQAKEEIDTINANLYLAVENPQLIEQKPILKQQWEAYKRTRQWSLDYYDEFYTRFMTKFDQLFFESQMVNAGLTVVKNNIGKVFTENEGAVIFPGENYGLHTRVFITKSGYPTYEGKEMGNAFAEYDASHFDKKIHIVGSEQSGYFQVVFKALELIDPDKFKDKQYHLPMGMVQLTDRKMSSRTGDILRVDWLIDQVKEAVENLFKEGNIASEDKAALLEQIAIGAIKYSVLKVGCTQNVSFDIKTSVSLEGNSGPYIQYTYARTQSILRKAEGEQGKENTEDDDRLLYNKSHYEIEESCLLRQIYQFPEIVQRAAESYSPNLVCEYVFTLAQEFNLFYQKHRILDVAEEQDRHFRLALTQSVGEVLHEGLRLLGIAAPERM